MRKPQQPPEGWNQLNSLHGEALLHILSLVPQSTHEGKYLHWDEIRHRPAPHELTHEEWWYGLKFRRLALYKPLPLNDLQGNPFVFAIPEQALELLYEIGQAAGSVPEFLTRKEARNRFRSRNLSQHGVKPSLHKHLVEGGMASSRTRNLMEEGIASSLIEGASTTRIIAKAMLRSERKPVTEGERMVLNNYQAMQFIIDQGKMDLTPEIVYQLHEIITRGTMDDPSASGRPRRGDETINIVDPSDNEVLHIPPPVEELPKRMEAMCKFANGETPEGFIHPLVRSIILHYWLAYDHPFKDGNGRCARVLFYWCMMRYDYWLCEFISISNVISRAPIQYARSFLNVQSDENDLTYFLLQQLLVVRKAIDELHDYLQRKAEQRRTFARKPELDSVFNERQIDLITQALRSPEARYDIRRHQLNYDVVHQTARTDLLGLVEKGLFIKKKSGRTFYFYPTMDMEHRLENLTPTA